MDHLRVFIGNCALKQSIRLLDLCCEIPERLCSLRQTKELCACHLLPQGLQVEAVQFTHELWECKNLKTLTVNGNPICNPVVIKAIQDFFDLFVLGDLLIIKVFSSSLLKFKHDFN